MLAIYNNPTSLLQLEDIAENVELDLAMAKTNPQIGSNFKLCTSHLQVLRGDLRGCTLPQRKFGPLLKLVYP